MVCILCGQFQVEMMKDCKGNCTLYLHYRVLLTNALIYVNVLVPGKEKVICIALRDVKCCLKRGGGKQALLRFGKTARQNEPL